MLTTPSRLWLVCLLGTCLGQGQAPADSGRGAPAPARVTLAEFPTQCEPPARFEPWPGFPQKEASKWMDAMPEGALLQAMMEGPMAAKLGLPSKQLAQLKPAVKAAYEAIAKDPDFKGVPGALRHAVAPAKGAGHYFLCRPEQVRADTPVIVFLHGFGGNFQFYAWAIKEAFPDSLVLVPSWGMSAGDMPARYLDEMCRDAAKRCGLPKIGTPWLMAISAGGPAGFRLHQADPAKYRGFVCLASAPTEAQAGMAAPKARILMVNGTEDERFPMALVRERAKRLRTKVPGLTLRERPGNHFFLMLDRRETLEQVKRWMDAPGK